MHRDAQRDLDTWYAAEHRKPLLIRGARQVGESALVRLFCESKGVKHWEMNLERHPRVHTVLASTDPEHIVREIGFVLGETISPEDGILFSTRSRRARPRSQPCPTSMRNVRTGG